MHSGFLPVVGEVYNANLTFTLPFAIHRKSRENSFVKEVCLGWIRTGNLCIVPDRRGTTPLWRFGVIII